MRLRCTSFTTTSAAFTKRFAFTPAMEAGLADHVWTLEELVMLLKDGQMTVAA